MEHVFENIETIYKRKNMEQRVKKNGLEQFYQERVLNYLEIIEMGENGSFKLSV